MEKFKYLIFTVVAFCAFVLMLSGCGGNKAVEKEMMDANTALEELIQAGGTPEEIAEVQALIDEAKELLASGDTQGARKKLEEARFRAIELKGQHELESRDPDRMVPDMGAEIDIGLVDVFFDYDQSRIRSDAAPVLQQNASVISSNLDRIKVVVVEGFCDIRGTEEYNLALGDQRAKSVISYLAGLGISVNLLESVSKGETEEWAEGTSESSYQQNRRAHFRVIAR